MFALRRSVQSMRNAAMPHARHAPRTSSLLARLIHNSKQSPADAAAKEATEEPPKPKYDEATEMLVSVNDKDVVIPKGATVLHACEEAGIEIPRFCYHDRLSIAGNCRMCLVEVVKSPKPVASCAMPAMPGMQIKTDTPLVHKAREGVMEFLLANHPLDCPICDQAGECDLQEQSLYFGSDKSRFREFKRSVEDKNMGPFVKTVMTRCIHCTRCVRFAKEVAGVPDLGTTGRGNAMEIGTYVEKVLDSELSGNVVDLCPVGALTSKPFAFTARPWELNSTESIDVMDALGSAIRVDVRNAEIMRILPRLNEDINEEWLGDKSRYAYDGLKRQRLDTPLVKKGNDFVAVEWEDALQAAAKALTSAQPSEIKAIAGDHADAESLIALKDLVNRLGSSNTECRQDGTTLSADIRSGYTFGSTIAGIEEADVCVLVGSNPRMEAPVLNARLRKSVEHHGLRVFSVGPKAELTYDCEDLGNDPVVLSKLLDGSHPLSKELASASKPMIVVGMGALKGEQGKSVTDTVAALAKKYPNLLNEDWNGINFLHTAASRTAGLDLGFVPGPTADDKAVKVVYLLGADDWAPEAIPNDAFVIYQGHHGDAGASRANVILPGAAYTEKSATYVNTEGRPQRTVAVVDPVGQARPDWKIIRALSEFVQAPLPYNTDAEVTARVVQVAPNLAHEGHIEQASTLTVADTAKASPAKLTGAFSPYFTNYFLTDPVSRSSPLLGKASNQLKTAVNSYV